MAIIFFLYQVVDGRILDGRPQIAHLHCSDILARKLLRNQFPLKTFEGGEDEVVN